MKSAISAGATSLFLGHVVALRDLEVGGYNAGTADAVTFDILAVGYWCAKLDAEDPGDCVDLVGGLQLTAQQDLFGHRLRGIL